MESNKFNHPCPAVEGSKFERAGEELQSRPTDTKLVTVV